MKKNKTKKLESLILKMSFTQVTLGPSVTQGSVQVVGPYILSAMCGTAVRDCRCSIERLLID